MSKPPKWVKIDLSAANHAISAFYEFPPASNQKFISPEFALPQRGRFPIVRRIMTRCGQRLERH
ncbi:MAG: hypothetical protein ACKO81_16425, partial [Planctomycetota bacterium]